MEIVRSFVEKVLAELQAPRPLIQVVIGPRQVGKTTGVRQLLQRQVFRDYHYVSADGLVLKSPSWILEQWLRAKQKSPKALLVIDEIQKVESWAEAIKQLWDEQTLVGTDEVKVILLGSSSLELHRGLSESLAGRFQLHRVHHWGPQESEEGYGLNLDQYLRFGGYPGSYSMIQDPVAWLSYMGDSIVDAVIGKDILSVARVKSPALFKQCFYLACSYAGQEISYTKLLGQLQDRGNTDLVKHYLELFEQAFLIKQIFKYSNKRVLSRSSSPKILPLCPALYSLTLDADYSPDNYGRAFELSLGCLLNSLPAGELYYWRSRNFEVDYVYRYGKKLWAIEVKSIQGGAMSSPQHKGLYEFKKHFPGAELVLMHRDNYQDEMEKIRSAITK